MNSTSITFPGGFRIISRENAVKIAPLGMRDLLSIIDVDGATYTANLP